MKGGILTEQEMYEGWHFCSDWGYMLVGPGMPELKTCTCRTIPKEK